MENKQVKEAPRNKGGRKTDRPVDRNRVFYLYVDHPSLTPAEVRQAVDEYLKKRRP